jgi:hypothetical protein
MKKMISLCLAVTFTLGIYALPPTDIPGKVLKSFHRDFPNVLKQTIQNSGNSVVFYFDEDDHSSCRVFYDLNGVLKEVIRYYDASKLSPFIRSKVNEKFAGKEISGVTEVVSANSRFYQINVQDTKVWYQIKCDADGRITREKKWHKS